MVYNIQNFHDAQLAALGGFNCNGNKSTLAALSTYTGSSAIGSYPMLTSSCCCGGGSIYGVNYGAFASQINDMTIFGPKSFYSADTVQSFNNYADGIHTKDIIKGGFKKSLCELFDNPCGLFTIAAAALKGVGYGASNLGEAIC